MASCFLMGAHDAPGFLQDKLNKVVEYLVLERCVTEFLVGSRGNFDAMAIAAIQHILRQYPQKNLVAYILEPYPFEERHHFVPEYFDGFFTPEGMESVPRRFSIEKANQKALDGSDYFVGWAYLSGTNSGKLLRRALQLEKKGFLEVIDLGK